MGSKIIDMKPQQQKNVHYFPGHMARTLSGLPSFVKLCDLVIEIADARAPFSTRNPELSRLIGEKPHVLLLSKEDKADPAITRSWVEGYAKSGLSTLAGNLKQERIKEILALLEPSLATKRAKEARLGMKRQPVRLLVVGIPNVGKSTLINSLAGHSVAKAANTPGVTRAEQWIKISEDVLLLDTPGILPMNYPDGAQAVRLALLGSIKEEVLPIDDLAIALLSYLREAYPGCLKERYGMPSLLGMDTSAVLNEIAAKRGYLLSGGVFDLGKAASGLIKDFQENALGRLSLERP
jgi:ribosome biogenesis GTPase A